MERTEAAAGPVGRPRPWLLVALGVAVALYAVTWLMPGKSAAPSAAPSKPRIAGEGRQRSQAAGPDVRLEALNEPRPAAAGDQRNPFRFYVPPPPPPPPVAPVSKPPPVPFSRRRRSCRHAGRAAAAAEDLADVEVHRVPRACRARGRSRRSATAARRCAGSEGDIIDGRYRLVRIGVESVVMEYPDGRGRETIRMSGQDCVTK